jgi:hypothetical protein
MCVYVYADTRYGPRAPMRTICALRSCFCAHFAYYHLVCALFAYSESNDIKSLDVAVHKTNAQYLRHAQCALSVHLYPPLCSATYTTRTFCVSIIAVQILCCTIFVHYGHMCTYCVSGFAVHFLYSHSQYLSEIIASIDWSIFVQQNSWSAIGAH